MANKEFDLAVSNHRDMGTLVVEDATSPLEFRITQSDILLASRRDETYCVVGRALKRSQLGAESVSVGPSITKLLLLTGQVFRYSTPGNIKESLKKFDHKSDKFEWNLPPGIYTLLVPSSDRSLLKNKTKEQVQKIRDDWDKFNQSFKKNGANGKGITKHKGRPINVREITMVRGVPRRRKSPKRHKGKKN